MPVFIIADAGINHMGNFRDALLLVDAAKECGADAIKFQDGFKTIPSLQKYSLPKCRHKDLKQYCEEIGIEYMCTAFDFDFIEFLKELDIKTWKVPSGEIANGEYLKRIPKDKKILFSIGGASLVETQMAQVALGRNAVPMECTSEYPAVPSSIHFNLIHVEGYSDHTMSNTTAIMAVPLGAKYIEHHIKLDDDCIDNVVSFNPEQFKEYVRLIREAESALGTGIKQPTEKEKELMAWARNRAG